MRNEPDGFVHIVVPMSRWQILAIIVVGLEALVMTGLYVRVRGVKERLSVMIREDRETYERAIGECRSWNNRPRFVPTPGRFTVSGDAYIEGIELPEGCADEDGVARDKVIYLLEDGGARCEAKPPADTLGAR